MAKKVNANEYVENFDSRKIHRAELVPFEPDEDNYIFISYSHKDSERVFEIIKQIYEAGYHVWYDEGIPLISNYRDVIAEHVGHCVHFMLFVSDNSLKSGFVKMEYQYAFDFADRNSYHLTVVNLPHTAELREDNPSLDMYQKQPWIESVSDNVGEIISRLDSLGIYKERKTRKAKKIQMKEGTAGYNNLLEKYEGTVINCEETPFAVVDFENTDYAKVFGSLASMLNDGFNIRNNPHEISDCKVYVAFLNSSNTNSEVWRYRIEEALCRKKDVLLVKTEKCELPFDLLGLSGIQALEILDENGWKKIKDTLNDKQCNCGKARHIKDLDLPGFDNVKIEGGYLLVRYTGNDTNVTVPQGITEIGDGAFRFCESLEQIKIPNSVTSIGKWAFYACISLKQINISDSVTSIGMSSFSNCTSLTQINIPDKVQYIGKWAFSYCPNLMIHTTKRSYAYRYAIKNDILTL
ncbi:MAG: leucine-rich repeat protein [Oscillospiraceae bacterium]|jgi:hypothetical protein|nr:leucine-rich repeat protein [Oscillospiraceae bacterium]